MLLTMLSLPYLKVGHKRKNHPSVPPEVIEMGNIRQAIVRLEGPPRKGDHMNIRTLKQAWWHGRVACSLAATALATVVLAATVVSSILGKPRSRARGESR